MTALYQTLHVDQYNNLYAVEFDDDQPLGTTSVQVYPYDSLLRISIPSGASADWWTITAKQAPAAAYKVRVDTVCRWTVRISSFTYDDADCAVGLALWSDRNNVYMLDWSGDNVAPRTGSRVGASEIVAGTSAFHAENTSGAISAPSSSTPLQLRFTYSRYANTLVYECSDDDGLTWETVHSLSPAFIPKYVGPFSKNWTPNFPATVADYDWMLFEHVPYAEQYRPVSNVETSAGEGISCRALTDLQAGADNAKVYAFAHKQYSYLFPPGARLHSHGNATVEQVVAVFCPREMPDGYNSLRLTATHQRSVGSGNTAWRVYAANQMYISGNNTLDTAKLGAGYDFVTFNTTNGSHSIAHTTELAIVKDRWRETWLLVTAQNTDVNTQCHMLSLDIQPSMVVADSGVGLL